MAFKSLGRQHYYLIAKHSGKALGFTGTNLGNGLCQMAFDPKNKLQQFRFDPGKNFYWVVSPHYERYLAIHASSQEDTVPAILWEWSPPQENLRFRLEPAGDGYYRIKAVHSNKFLDVYHALTTDNAGVVQHSLTTTDNQLFKPVPVIDQAIGNNATSYAEVNELMRTGALGLIGLIPDAGGALKFLVGMFWTEHNKLADLWDQMKSYVDVRVRELLKEAQLKQLREMLAGQLKVINEVQKSPGLKGDKLEGVILKIVEKEPHFLEQTVEVLPYMVGLGTIMITLRRMMVTHYKELFGKDPDAATLAFNKEKLKESIKEYTDAVNKSKKELMEWRMSHVKNRDDSQRAGVGWFSDIKDTYDGWAMQWHIYENGNGDEDYKTKAENAIQQRRKQVTVQYEADLNEFLRPAKFWPYLDTDSTPYAEKLVKKQVGSFGGPYSHNPFDGVDGQQITKITIHSAKDNRLCGLEVFYDGKSSGLKGNRGTNADTIVLEDGEYITSAYGYFYNIVEGLWLSTQRGNTVGAGKTYSQFFSADLADSFNPKLAKISGSYNGDTIEHLTFHWEYMD